MMYECRHTGFIMFPRAVLEYCLASMISAQNKDNEVHTKANQDMNDYLGAKSGVSSTNNNCDKPWFCVMSKLGMG